MNEYNTNMKEYITKLIADQVKEFDGQGALGTKWGKPLVGFADAKGPYILNLKKLIGQEHGIPTDVLADAKTVIVYFVPFTEEIPRENRGTGLASPQWAQLYEETNALFHKVNGELVGALEEKGYHGKVSPEAMVFDREKIISKWSQRHFAYAAGLGTFGVNNMLITEKGCCGRISSVVTNLEIEPGRILEQERCLYKAKGSCGICMKHCPTGALTVEGFNREKCFERCLENAAVYTEFGNSYASETGEAVSDSGSEVCGKCVCRIPCSFRDPTMH